MNSEQLQKAQKKFRKMHGQEQTWRLYASVESVVHGADIHHDTDPWRNQIFMGTAASLYSGLADVDRLDAAALGEII
ncbi:MAG: hypothetical protein OXQ89_10310 [Rhodospirillaceae bacterium]|nr:hypothetical protein [Rhodospirillaceae bacterium]